MYLSEYLNGNSEAIYPSSLGFKLACIPTSFVIFCVKVVGHNYWQYTQENAMKVAEQNSF